MQRGNLKLFDLGILTEFLPRGTGTDVGRVYKRRARMHADRHMAPYRASCDIYIYIYIYIERERERHIVTFEHAVLLRRAVPCRAVPCRAVPCCAVPCSAVPCLIYKNHNIY